MVKGLGDKVIVKRAIVPNRTESGIYLTKETEVVKFYEVSDIGEEVKNFLPDLSIGDVVIVHERAMTLAETVEENGSKVEYYALRCGDIICVVEDYGTANW